jgi:hypothetical protein
MCGKCSKDFFRANGLCNPCPQPASTLIFIIGDVAVWLLLAAAAIGVRDRMTLSYIVLAIRALSMLGAVGKMTEGADIPAWIITIYEVLYIFSGDYSFVKPDCVTPAPWSQLFGISLAYNIAVFVPIFLGLGIAWAFTRPDGFTAWKAACVEAEDEYRMRQQSAIRGGGGNGGRGLRRNNNEDEEEEEEGEEREVQVNNNDNNSRIRDDDGNAKGNNDNESNESNESNDTGGIRARTSTLSPRATSSSRAIGIDHPAIAAAADTPPPRPLELPLRPRTRDYWVDRAVRMCVIWGASMYLSITSLAFETLSCQRGADGAHRMITRQHELCFTGNHIFLSAASCVLLVGFTLGFPLGMLKWVKRVDHRHQLHQDERFMERWNYLYEFYNVRNPTFWLIEFPITCIVAAGNSVLRPHVNYQMSISVAVFAYKLLYILVPFIDWITDVIQAVMALVSLVAINLTFFARHGVFEKVPALSISLSVIIALFLAVALLGMVGMVVFLMLKPAGAAEAERQRKALGGTAYALGALAGSMSTSFFTQGDGSDEEVQGVLRSAGIGGAGTGGLDPDAMKLEALGGDDDAAGEDGGLFRRMTSMFQDTFPTLFNSGGGGDDVATAERHERQELPDSNAVADGAGNKDGGATSGGGGWFAWADTAEGAADQAERRSTASGSDQDSK